MPNDTESLRLSLGGDAIDPKSLDELAFSSLPRTEQTSDFHCVTTWSHVGVHWGGVAFAELFHQFVVPRVHPTRSIKLVALRCRDGYRTALPLEDLLAADVLLADSLNRAPLTRDHGAPLRLIAPAHYGYKNAKHLSGVEFWVDDRSYRKPGLGRIIDHPRGRVALEERARGVPGALLRWVYRPLIGPNVRLFRIKSEAPR